MLLIGVFVLLAVQALAALYFIVVLTRLQLSVVGELQASSSLRAAQEKAFSLLAARCSTAEAHVEAQTEILQNLNSRGLELAVSDRQIVFLQQQVAEQTAMLIDTIGQLRAFQQLTGRPAAKLRLPLTPHAPDPSDGFRREPTDVTPTETTELEPPLAPPTRSSTPRPRSAAQSFDLMPDAAIPGEGGADDEGAGEEADYLHT